MRRSLAVGGRRASKGRDVSSQFVATVRGGVRAGLGTREARGHVIRVTVHRSCYPATMTLVRRKSELSPLVTLKAKGVFRFDTDKRPTTWIRFAARYAKTHPDARFLLVGGGRLFEDCVQLARDLGIIERILFVGHSTDVGYWMKKMDVSVLMSSFEGLPNVLIEAQYLGVPVVSTPAGGAAECFIEGVTGHILSCAEKTDLDEACAKVQALLGRAQDASVFEAATRDFLDPNFSISKMLENFLRITCQPIQHA